MNGSLEDKVVIITGAGRGIGRELALYCAAEGEAVIVNDPGVGQAGDGGDASPAEITANDIIAAGGKAVANFGNVADPKEASNIIEDAVTRFGRVDAVVNNAGILRDTIWHKMSYEDWKSVIEVNLTGVFNVSKAATPYFREQKSGSFIHFTSTSGLIGNIGQANYSAAKGALVAVTKALSQEVAKRNITVNAVAPGFIKSDMTSDLDENELKKLVPANRFGEAQEVADLVSFLVSKKSSYITGEVININGGIYS